MGSNCSREKVPHMSLGTEEVDCKGSLKTKEEVSGSICRVSLCTYNFYSIDASAYSFKLYLSGNQRPQAARGPNMVTSDCPNKATQVSTVIWMYVYYQIN